MSAPSASFLVARCGDHLYVKSLGLANMKGAPTLDAFLAEERTAGGAMTAYLDLSECTGMDSTFMGVLVGNAGALQQVGGRLVVVNPSPGNLRLLNMLGITSVVSVVPKCTVPQVEFVALSAVASTGVRDRMQLVHRAHLSLMALSPDNQSKFSAFVVALEGDLARMDQVDRAPAAEPAAPSKDEPSEGAPTPKP
jgi:anti-sigma B factor antagonist